MSDRDGDFRAFAIAHSPSLLRVAAALTGDEHLAEDLLQSTLIKVYVSWGRVRDAGSRYAYARRTMVTTHTSWWRRRSSHEPPIPTDRVAERPGPDHVQAIDDKDEVRRLLATLTRTERAVLVLRLLEDLSVAETAHELGIPEGTVKSHTSRALHKLRVEATTGTQRPVTSTTHPRNALASKEGMR